MYCVISRENNKIKIWEMAEINVDYETGCYKL